MKNGVIVSVLAASLVAAGTGVALIEATEIITASAQANIDAALDWAVSAAQVLQDPDGAWPVARGVIQGADAATPALVDPEFAFAGSLADDSHAIAADAADFAAGEHARVVGGAAVLTSAITSNAAVQVYGALAIASGAVDAAQDPSSLPDVAAALADQKAAAAEAQASAAAAHGQALAPVIVANVIQLKLGAEAIAFAAANAAVTVVMSEVEAGSPAAAGAADQGVTILNNVVAAGTAVVAIEAHAVANAVDEAKACAFDQAALDCAGEVSERFVEA